MNDKAKKWIEQPIRETDVFYLTSHPGKTFLALGQQGSKMIFTTTDDGTGKALEDRLSISISSPSIYKQEKDFKGVNPFLPNNVRFTAFDLGNTLSMLGINRRKDDFSDETDKIGWRENPTDKNEIVVEVPRLNWNPYFIIDGEKIHYQRGFVWSLEQKQALIDSIYRGLECGRLIVHKKSYNEQVRLYRAGFTDCANFDIVDGKQRLSTIVAFCRGEFADAEGNYYSDLSDSAKRMFMNYRGLMYGEIENVTVQQIRDAFLNNAVQGTPVSMEHIEFMRSIK